MIRRVFRASSITARYVKLKYAREILFAALRITTSMGFCAFTDLQKEYAVLSDLKREVESVLKEGRRQVDDKKADSKLSSELDGIKALYNKVSNC